MEAESRFDAFACNLGNELNFTLDGMQEYMPYSPTDAFASNGGGPFDLLTIPARSPSPFNAPQNVLEAGRMEIIVAESTNRSFIVDSEESLCQYFFGCTIGNLESGGAGAKTLPIALKVHLAIRICLFLILSTWRSIRSNATSRIPAESNASLFRLMSSRPRPILDLKLP